MTEAERRDLVQRIHLLENALETALDYWQLKKPAGTVTERLNLEWCQKVLTNQTVAPHTIEPVGT